MDGFLLGFLMILFTMFITYIIEILARYYAMSSGYMERCRTIVALILLMQLLYIILPTERGSLTY